MKILLNGFDDLAAIWRFLIRNISINFDNKTIDYYSLLRTFNEINFILRTDPSHSVSLCLSKRYALLWFYLRHTHESSSTAILKVYQFEASILYLLMKFDLTIEYELDEFYPSQLCDQFGKFDESNSIGLNHIVTLLKRYDPQSRMQLSRNSRGGFELYSIKSFN